MIHWLIHLLGIDTQQSWAYDFWSGFGPCLISATTLGAGVWAFVRSRNCHVHRCWRIGRHRVAGTEHVVCRHHHPDPRVRDGLRHHHLVARR